MESIIQQQQQQQYLLPTATPKATTTTKMENYTNSNIVTFTDAKTNNDTTTTKTTSIITADTVALNTTNKNYQNESFHSQNFIYNKAATNTNTTINLILQQQQNDHANFLSDTTNDIDENEYNKMINQNSTNINNLCNDSGNNDDDDDDSKNDNKNYNLNVTNNDEIVENIHKSSSSTNLRLKFRKSHTCGSLFANCNCDSEKNNLLSTTVKTSVPEFPTFTIKPPVLNLSEKNYKQNQIVDDNNIEDISKIRSNSVNNTTSSTSTYTSNDLNHLYNCCNNNLRTTTADTLKALKTEATITQQLNQQNKNQDHNICGFSLPHDESNIISKIKNDDQSSDLKITKSDGCILKKNSQQKKTLNNCKKKNRKIFSSYSHPDTNFIFTDENCNPNSNTNLNNNQIKTIITKCGNICVKHQKRSSSPNIGNFTILDVHPEILLKIHKSDPNLKRIDKKLSLESESSTSSIVSLATSSSTSTSFNSVKQNDLKLKSQSINKIEDNNFETLKFREITLKNSIDVYKPIIDSNISPKRSLPNLPKHSINIDNITDNNNSYSTDKDSELTSSIYNGKQHSISESDKSTNIEIKNFKLESAHKYFQESGILGPNIKAEKVNKLIRRTSKIIQDSNFIEHVRKNSKIILSNSPIPIKKTSKIMNGEDQNIIKGRNFIENNMNDKGLQKNDKISENFNNFEKSEQQQQQQQNDVGKSSNNNSNNNNNGQHYTNSNNKLNCCNCDSRIQTLIEEIGTLKELVSKRDNEIHKLKREIHKLKSVLQQTNASRILLNEKNIFQHKHHSGGHGQQNTSTSKTPSPTPSSSNQHNQEQYYHHHHHHQQKPHLHPQYQQQQQTQQDNSTNNDISNSKLINGEYDYVGLVGAPITKTNYDKKIIKTTNQDEDNVLREKINLDNNKTCATCISKRSFSYQQPPMTVAPMVVKKQGVSGESCDATNNRSQNIPIPKYEKDFRSKQLIKDAIMDNDFLKNIDSTQVRELVESMYNLDVANGEFVIREGDAGSHLYVSAEGNFEVIKNDIVLGIMGPGKAFGELAILYNCTRTASIRVLSDDARVWVLDRRIFQQIMMRTGMQRIEENIRFLRSVPLLKDLSSDVLAKIADVLEVEFYPAGTYIIRQGASGDTFFLISQGTVKVTQKLGNLQEEKEIRTLQRGDYFGEQALINVDKRTANIIAMTPGVECLTLDRDSFNHLIGDLCELKEKNYGDENRILAMKFSDEKETKVFGANIVQEFPELKLTDLEIVATLGIGGFGRVELIKCYHENRVATYALKCLKKKHIIDTRQEEHVFSERTIMLTCKSPFICRLYKTFRDDKYLYMMLEACMGGEVWTMLRDRGSFNDIQTQFITGCVLQAFEYLHSRNIIYRDLKPENLMLSEQGYVKLVDFGFAKYIGNSQKTWTFCGTPEYVAPEIILNKGHDRAVDYWALGILIHELLNGTPPFTANDPMKTYNIILKGIDMIDFPKHMSKSAVTLIKKLCRDVPAERLGYSKAGIEDIKKNKWFQGFDWDSLANLTLIPPFLRPVTNPLDTSYFDKFSADTDIPPDETSGWDSDF